MTKNNSLKSGLLSENVAAESRVDLGVPKNTKLIQEVSKSKSKFKNDK